MALDEDHDSEVARPTAFYPAAVLSPHEFEAFVADLLDAITPRPEGYQVTVQDRVKGIDGSYTFDATVRYRVAGLDFLVIVEAKRYKNPIKRELVQVLLQKVQSVGGHKGVLISTSPFQRGALEFALQHGIALVTVTEGRFLYETRSRGAKPALSRAQADSMGLQPFAGHVYSPGTEPGSTAVTLVATNYPDHVAELLLGIPPPQRSVG